MQIWKNPTTLQENLGKENIIAINKDGETVLIDTYTIGALSGIFIKWCFVKDLLVAEEKCEKYEKTLKIIKEKVDEQPKLKSELQFTVNVVSHECNMALKD